MPLYELPVLILSVFIQQIIHEFGHALAASMQVWLFSLWYTITKRPVSRESIPVVISGASLFLMIPTAYVGMPLSDLHDAEPLTEARIMAAGTVHNLACWAAMALSRASGLEEMATGFWYKDVSSVGRSVVDVDSVSGFQTLLRSNWV